MSVHTVELSSPSRRKIEPGAWVAYSGAAAFAISAVWYSLATRDVTQAAPPQLGPKVGAERGLHLYYRWFATTLPQERLYTVIAIAGFGCLAAVAVAASAQFGRDRALARASAFSIAAGAAIWIVANLVLLGGHRAIGLMATHANPVQAVNSIAFTVDTIVSALSLATFALIGAGLLGFGYAARTLRGYRAWAGASAAAGLLMLAVAWSYASGPGDLTDWLLLISGVAALPAWLILSTRAQTVNSISREKASSGLSS